MLLQSLLSLTLALTFVDAATNDTSNNVIRFGRPRKPLTDAEIMKKYANIAGKSRNFKNTTKSLDELMELERYEMAVENKIKKKSPKKGPSGRVAGLSGPIEFITNIVSAGNPIVGLINTIGKLVLRVGKIAEEAKDLSDSHRSFLAKVCNELFFDIKDVCNVVIYDKNHHFSFKVRKVIYETVVEFRGRKFTIYLFVEGTLVNKHQGKNGWPNMAVIGDFRYSSDKRTVKFNKKEGCATHFKK